MAKNIANWSIKIFTSWKRYRKLIPAIIGVVLLITLKHYEIEIPGLNSAVLDWLVGAALVFGVERVRNEPNTESITIETEVTKTGDK